MAGSKDVMDVAEADRSDEAWIRTANSDQSVRIRSLTMILQRGATLTDVRLIEQDDETWSIWFRLSDRTGEFRLNLAKSDEAKPIATSPWRSPPSARTSATSVQSPVSPTATEADHRDRLTKGPKVWAPPR